MGALEYRLPHRAVTAPTPPDDSPDNTWLIEVLWQGAACLSKQGLDKAAVRARKKDVERHYNGSMRRRAAILGSRLIKSTMR